MKQSIRARRMARKHNKGKPPGLNLTSLMDIFTILLFFLMVNQASDVTVITDTENIKMPLSISDEPPKETLLLQVSGDEMIIGGKLIAKVSDVKGSEEDVIAALDDELRFQASRREPTEEEVLNGRPLTIQGHNTLPYIVLKKIMATAAQADYRDLSLAVTKLEKKVGEAD